MECVSEASSSPFLVIVSHMSSFLSEINSYRVLAYSFYLQEKALIV